MLKYIDLKNLAPIVITTFNRPDHTQSMIESLLKNDLIDKSEYIFFVIIIKVLMIRKKYKEQFNL